MSKDSPKEGSLQDQAVVHDQVTQAVLTQFAILKANIESGDAPVEHALVLLGGLYKANLLTKPAFAEHINWFSQALTNAGANIDVNLANAIKLCVIEDMKEDHCNTAWIEDGAEADDASAAASAPSTGDSHDDAHGEGAGAGGGEGYGEGASEYVAAAAAAGTSSTLDGATAAMGEMTLAGDAAHGTDSDSDAG